MERAEDELAAAFDESVHEHERRRHSLDRIREAILATCGRGAAGAGAGTRTALRAAIARRKIGFIAAPT